MESALKTSIGHWCFGIVVLVGLFALTGCQTDAQRIRESNEAARKSQIPSLPTQIPSPTFTPIPTSTPAPQTPTPEPTSSPLSTTIDTPSATPVSQPNLSTEISAFDLRDGDCFNVTGNPGLAQGVEFEVVELVPCSGDWQLSVINSFIVEQNGEYPGEDHFQALAIVKCDRRYSLPLQPTEESWQFGDRTVNCVQESYGLATTDPEKLDRIVSSLTLQEGECFNFMGNPDLAQGVEFEVVELVPCSGDWHNRIINSILVETDGEFPGDSHFQFLAIVHCDRRYSFPLVPTQESWGLGDRTISCLQESYGLARTAPGKLDRIVNSLTLQEGECFSETTEYTELVSCSDEWEFRVLSNISIDLSGAYPSANYFALQANDQCDRHFSIWYEPSRESWELGDRTVNCLQESYGLATTDPDKLDRIVNSLTLQEGECFSETTEYTELVSCSGDWDFRVIKTFEVNDSSAYPGESYFQNEADNRCGLDYSFYQYPLPEHWSIGDRTVLCLGQR